MTRKRKRQGDFQKVKLKIGKKKPRTDNATCTNFKTKGIHLPDQLKEDGILPTNNRKLNVKDLLAQMHHYNAGVKQNALIGLKELLSQHDSVLDSHLSSILSEVAAVFTDKDASVRAAAIRLLYFLAPRLSSERIAPFFPLVSAHLSSAMTHIVEGIQEDALKVLDVLLENYPGLLTDRSNVLLKNFVELISHQKLSKGLKSGGKASAWMLSVSPNRRLTSQQWRLNVLSRLRKFLQALVRDSKATEESGKLFEGAGKTGTSLVAALEVRWENLASGLQTIQLYENSGSQPCVLSPFRLRPLVGVGAGVEDDACSVENVKVLIQTLVPLLIECWVEASPVQLIAPVAGNLLEPEAVLLMQQVLSIIQLLWRLLQDREGVQKTDTWLRTTYLDDFNHHFMLHFPYSVIETIRQKKKQMSKSDKRAALQLSSIDPLALNLTLCQVMVSLTSTPTLQLDIDWIQQIQKFVIENLSAGNKLTSKQLSGMLAVVWRLVLLPRNRASTEQLLRAVYLQYQQKGLILPVRTMLIKFFSGLYLQEKESNPHIARSRVLSRWLAGLPLQLIHLGARNYVLSAQLLDTIHAAAARSNKELLQSLQVNACRLYNPQDGTLVLLPPESQQQLVQLLYFLPSISLELLSCLSHCCTMGRLSSNLAANLIRIIHIRSSFMGWTCSVQDSPLSDTGYFNFLFSVLTGFSREELSWLQNGSGNPHISQTQLSPVRLYLTDLDQFVHHWAVTKVVCHCLSAVPSRSQCFDILQSAIVRHLAGLTVIPDSTVGSVLFVLSKLLEPTCVISDFSLKFLARCCYSLLHSSLTMEKPNAGHMQKRTCQVTLLGLHYFRLCAFLLLEVSVLTCEWILWLT
ncbi:testis-expressed protein 10 homolog isoform X2 [Latimeria chalumnae]|uniref:testis-expressed protein 10 homolog isoform X2 n=1 Tax=Latimeria chalumnae TaxID=7897 RepID=UPI00313C1243